MIFIFPIGWNNYGSYLAKEILTNALRNEFSDVETYDMNNDFFCSFTSTDTVLFSNAEKKQILKENILKLKTNNVLDNFDEYLAVINSTNDLLVELTNSVDPSIKITLNGVVYKGLSDNLFSVYLKNILEYVDKQESIIINSFIESRKNKFKDKKIFFISVTTLSQFISALYLSKWLKNNNSNIQVVLGGNYISRIIEKITQNGVIFKYIDFIVDGCGEKTLPELAKAIKSGCSVFNNIPNLWYFDGESVIQTVRDFNISDESSFSVENCYLDYFVSNKVVPIYITRGCYWRKCAFCSIPNESGQFRIRSIDEVIDDIKLYISHGVTYFSFIDEAISPFLLNKLAQAILDNNLKITWAVLARFDIKLDNQLCQKLYFAGCRRIQFGMESYSSQVLNLMNKGIDKAIIRPVIKNCVSAGISVNLFCLIGFPGETKEEAQLTIDFVKSIIKESYDNYKTLITADFSKFLLDVDSPIYQQMNLISSNTNIALYEQYSQYDYDIDSLIYNAELEYSSIIHKYIGNEKNNISEPFYINETYWFLFTTYRKKIIKETYQRKFFNGIKLLKYPHKKIDKLYVLKEIADNFEFNKMYSEAEINEVLKNVFDDYIMIRRSLIEFSLLNRTNDGSNYWRGPIV